MDHHGIRAGDLDRLDMMLLDDHMSLANRASLASALSCNAENNYYGDYDTNNDRHHYSKSNHRPSYCYCTTIVVIVVIVVVVVVIVVIVVIVIGVV